MCVSYFIVDLVMYTLQAVCSNSNNSTKLQEADLIPYRHSNYFNSALRDVINSKPGQTFGFDTP